MNIVLFDWGNRGTEKPCRIMVFLCQVTGESKASISRSSAVGHPPTFFLPAASGDCSRAEVGCDSLSLRKFVLKEI